MHASSSASPGAGPQSPVTMSAASAPVASPGGGVASTSRPSSPPIDAPPGVLQAKEDMYSGVIVHAEQLTELSAEGFTAALGASLEWWEGLGKRGVWLKVPLAAAALVPLAASRGFIFHHAEPVGASASTPYRTFGMHTPAHNSPSNTHPNTQTPTHPHTRHHAPWQGHISVTPISAMHGYVHPTTT